MFGNACIFVVRVPGAFSDGCSDWNGKPLCFRPLSPASFPLKAIELSMKLPPLGHDSHWGSRAADHNGARQPQ